MDLAGTIFLQLTNDGAPEIVVSSGGIEIYEFIAGQFIQSYACVWGHNPRIN